MLFGVPISEIAAFVAALALGGMVTGFMAGLLGIGGGGIIVPVLYELFKIMGVDEGVRWQICVATSLAIIVPTSIRSFRSHGLRGSVDHAVLFRLGPWVAAGVIIGVIIGSHSQAGALKAVFVASSLFMAARIAFFQSRKLSEVKALPGLPWDGVAGLFIGLISTLVGIGGGVYISGYMTLFGWPIHTAVGTAAGFGPIIAIPATIGYVIEGWRLPGLPPLSLGFVNLLGALIIAPISVFAAPFGVRVAHSLSRRTLEYVFIGFLLFVAARFTISLIASNL